ncbi:MAG: anhydro-N-acetylmuramic acid kinase [Planctomycetota bacterium]
MPYSPLLEINLPSSLITAIGLMSGTSGDGVDAALVKTDGKSRIDFLGGLTVPYAEDLRLRLLEASQHDVPTTELLRLEREITIRHAEAVSTLLKKQPANAPKATLVGFHGHTIRHIPRESLTMQIGNPWQLAEAVGLPVVSDFRRNDVAKNGQGAPLVSMFHKALFDDCPRPVGVLNLGGVANLTWLGESDEIIAGDTGPGCGLIDEWAQEMANLPHDTDGKLASKGKIHNLIVSEAISESFFNKQLPKSADRYDFDHIDVSMLSVEDGAATLCAVTARAVLRAIDFLPAPPTTLWVTGGGVHNPVIMSMLAEHFEEVRSVEERNLSPDTLEAECFAWLAVRHKRGLPLTIPETTGCDAPATGAFTTG